MMNPRLGLFLLALFASASHAVLPEPNFLIFGQVTGTPPWLTSGDASGLALEIREQGGDVVFATATIAVDGSYALRVPIDSVDPQAPATSRPGVPLDLYLDGFQLDAADATVALVLPDTGQRGTFVQLDIDLNALVPGTGFSIANAQTDENAAGGNVMVTISLTGNAGGATQTVDYVSVEETARAATSDGCVEGDDFVPIGGTAQFDPGVSQVSLPISLCDDAVPEIMETFRIRLTNPSNQIALSRSEATVTIVDDDGAPQIFVDDVTVQEPVSGITSASFGIRLNAPQAVAVTFDYATTDGTATAGQDYLPASGSARIDPGATELPIFVSVLADLLNDDAETFTLQISNVSGVELGDAEGVATITDAMRDGTLLTDDGSGQTTLDGPIDIALAPAETFLYVANQLGESITRFAVDPSDSTLSGETPWSVANLPGVDLRGLNNIELSPDGTWLLAGASTAGNITLLAVNGAGDLSVGPVAAEGAADPMSTEYAGLDQSSDAVFSPDGNHIYVVSPQSDSVTTLTLESGTLLMTEIETDGTDDSSDAGPEVRNLTDPSDILISPQGTDVYVAAPASSAVLHFARDAVDTSPGYGTLSYVTSYTDALTPALDGVNRIVMTADGDTLYAVSGVTGQVVAFDVGAAGALALTDAVSTAEPGTLASASALGLNGDDSILLSTSEVPGSLHVFDTAPSPRQVLLAQRDVAIGLAGARALAAVPGQPGHVYVAAYFDNRVSLFTLAIPGTIFNDSFETSVGAR